MTLLKVAWTAAVAHGAALGRRRGPWICGTSRPRRARSPLDEALGIERAGFSESASLLGLTNRLGQPNSAGLLFAYVRIHEVWQDNAAAQLGL